MSRNKVSDILILNLIFCFLREILKLVPNLDFFKEKNATLFLSDFKILGTKILGEPHSF